jgi:hypothetical protein
VGDFDFLVGNWRVANRKLAKRLAGSDDWQEFSSSARCWNLFDGNANVDEFAFPDGTYGMTMRLYHPDTGKWWLHWSASSDGVLLPPVVGAFADGQGTFYGDDSHEGTPVRVRYIWSEITEASARWAQAFSIDGERTWETNWVMDFARI